jgi:hypothetical protein
MKLIKKPWEGVISGIKKFAHDARGNAMAAAAYGATFALLILAVGVYAINMVLKIANITVGDPLYDAISAIPGGVVTVVGVTILMISIVCIAIAMSVFGGSMGQGVGRQ